MSAQNPAPMLRDVFVCRSAYKVGGAKVVADRNQLFVEEAARLEGRACTELRPVSREGMKATLASRLLFLAFRLDTTELKPLARSARRGELANVWLDHGALGLTAPLLRAIGLWARLRGKRPARIHLFHHNDEARYLRDEYRESGAPLSLHHRFQLGLIWLQQGLGTACAHRNYFISPSECRGGRAMVLPPSWPAHEPGAPQENTRGKDVLLVGSRFFANEHGFRWYVENVAERIPAPTIIAGRDMDAVFTSGGKVTVLGFVPDLDALYARARIVAVPIFRGAGTKVKLVEALNNGCQVIATPEACDGIADQEALIASGQLIRADGDSFADRLRAELEARPQAPRYPRDSFAHERLLPRFLQFYQG